LSVICLADPALVFVDANVLRKAITRTLLIVSGHTSDFRATWSDLALRQADAHLAPDAIPVSDLAERFGWTTTPTAHDAARFPLTKPTDRQILADAVAARASYLVTEDVDDFDEGELMEVGIAAVSADLFLSMRTSDRGYLEALGRIAAGRQRPPRTPAEIHAAMGRQHPRLANAMAHLFPGVEVMSPANAEAEVTYRGNRCIRCGVLTANPGSIRQGFGPECQPRIEI
jgi:hypothetical protein